MGTIKPMPVTEAEGEASMEDMEVITEVAEAMAMVEALGFNVLYDCDMNFTNISELL